MVHRTIKIKSVGVKSSTNIDFNKEKNQKGSKFEVGDPCKNINIKKYFSKKQKSILKKFL